VWHLCCGGEGRPSLANFAVIPAPGVGQLDRRIDCLNLRSILGADALNTQDVGPLHGYCPEPFAGNREIIVRHPPHWLSAGRQTWVGSCYFAGLCRPKQAGIQVIADQEAMNA